VKPVTGLWFPVFVFCYVSLVPAQAQTDSGLLVTIDSGVIEGVPFGAGGSLRSRSRNGRVHAKRIRTGLLARSRKILARMRPQRRWSRRSTLITPIARTKIVCI